jgi:hypothetical protein
VDGFDYSKQPMKVEGQQGHGKPAAPQRGGFLGHGRHGAPGAPAGRGGFAGGAGHRAGGKKQWQKPWRGGRPSKAKPVGQ